MRRARLLRGGRCMEGCAAGMVLPFSLLLAIFQHYFRLFSGLPRPQACMLTPQKWWQGRDPPHTAGGGAMSHPSDPPRPLSVYRAFVVQFDPSTDVARGHFAG